MKERKDRNGTRLQPGDRVNLVVEGKSIFAGKTATVVEQLREHWWHDRPVDVVVFGALTTFHSYEVELPVVASVVRRREHERPKRRRSAAG